jgi:hypothetical protein
MPFDNTAFRQPTVTVLPPTPPEPPEGDPPRLPPIRIEIEIVDRRAAQPGASYRLGQATFWVLMLALLAALIGCAHAQTSTSTSRRMGGVTYTDGVNADGSRWTGTSRRMGSVEYFDSTDQYGNVTRCTSRMMGSVETQGCRP